MIIKYKQAFLGEGLFKNLLRKRWTIWWTKMWWWPRYTIATIILVFSSLSLAVAIIIATTVSWAV
jgi:hypothetical protein